MANTPDGVRKDGSYQAYLLRLWQEEKASNCWRASLETVDTPGRIGFSSLEALFGYLRQITGSQLRPACGLDAKAEEVKEET